MPTVTLIFFCLFSLLSASCPNDGDEEKGKIDSAALFNLPGYGLGVNIGNTLDAIGSNEWHAKETGWGNPAITKEFIKALKGIGYKTIRLPVTWAEYIGPAPDYQIGDCIFSDCSSCPNRMDRVQEAVNWILEEDMYCILNLHHDGGHSDKSWILKMSTEETETLKKFEKVWNQIALRFRDAPGKLIFESMNEIGFDDIWNRWGADQSKKDEAYRKLNALNQLFTDTVRATGGGNAARRLLISGYWTDIDATCDPLFKMPQDTAKDSLILSLHYYTPAVFCILEEDASWGKNKTDWGSGSTANADYNELAVQFTKIKDNFIDKGIPVILGEYGVSSHVSKVEAGRVRWMTAVTQACLDNGICPALWDTGGDIKRQPPYEISGALKQSLAEIKIK